MQAGRQCTRAPRSSQPAPFRNVLSSDECAKRMNKPRTADRLDTLGLSVFFRLDTGRGRGERRDRGRSDKGGNDESGKTARWHEG